MDAVVTCTNLTKSFPNVTAVNGVSVTVNQGEVFGLVGPDGAGKTTTMRMLCGILPPSEGSIEILGRRVPDEIDCVASDIGYMSQRFSLYGDLTVAENVEFFGDLYQVPHRERADRAEKLLAASRISQFKSRLADNLSGGMKQKLALVCTLIHTPKVLFLDEPTTGVDPVSRREFWQILYDLVTDGMTLVVSTPYMDEADRCQRLGLMNLGSLLRTATPKELRDGVALAIVDFECVNPQAARRMLANNPSVFSVQAFGNRVHAAVSGESIIDRLRAELDAAGAGIESVSLVPPSLEDAFVTQLEEASRE